MTLSEGQEYRQSGTALGKKGVVLSSAEKGTAVKAAMTGVCERRPREARGRGMTHISAA